MGYSVQNTMQFEAIYSYILGQFVSTLLALN